MHPQTSSALKSFSFYGLRTFCGGTGVLSRELRATPSSHELIPRSRCLAQACCVEGVSRGGPGDA